VLEPVPLDGLTPFSVDEQVAEFFAALDDVSAPASAERRLTAVLGWLWDTIVGPVLDQPSISGSPQNESWPRLWWCVSELLSFLTVHAVGHHRTPEEPPSPKTVTDRVVSSYTPTIRALAHARRIRPGNSGRSWPGGPGDGRGDALHHWRLRPSRRRCRDRPAPAAFPWPGLHAHRARGHLR
jgi:hypothetical protein